ncbi:MAG: hypothetical protein U5L04_09260 [Trueperaceae bacterium]|nr:hypothetical protein [Trueperaceae bacterium]
MNDAALSPDDIDILGAEVVGTNVAMTYRVYSLEPRDAVEQQLDGLLRARLGLYAITLLHTEPRERDDGSESTVYHFSVMASPLDRLFHKIGPSVTLTFLKHHAEALNMSVAQLTRYIAKLASTETIATACRLKPWDAAKLLGYAQQHAPDAQQQQVKIFETHRLEPSPRAPLLDLEDFPDLVAAHDGHVALTLPSEFVAALPS